MLFRLHKFYVNMSKTIIFFGFLFGVWDDFSSSVRILFETSKISPSRLVMFCVFFKCALKLDSVFETSRASFACLSVCLLKIVATFGKKGEQIKLIKKLIKYFEFVSVKNHLAAYVCARMRHVTCAFCVNNSMTAEWKTTTAHDEPENKRVQNAVDD